MRLLFADPSLRRLYTTGTMLPGMDEVVTAHFFEAAAVLSAVPDLATLRGFRAFAASPLKEPRANRWVMGLVAGWKLVFTVENSPPPSVSLERLIPEVRASRRAR